ncbi:AzlD domain-containing protein [Pseudomonas sp. NFR16]|uniref:AzlD domain-containing protein n=1 Tax=Pseudomonas sp. NFR16 TaxID=1566248 RepID=UPI0008CBCF90|nr:AzlD domain-containing protein [Pseudomonas sp. NFR16]SEI63354.1 Branched-chain amino acid transport protein [Pseudomonas sp. NFR16]
MTAWLVILCMSAILFMNRYLFLEPRLPLKLGRNVRDFLGFAVPGLLTAICAPIIFLPDGELTLAPTNPYLLAGLFAVAVMIWKKNVLLTLFLSMAVFYLLRALL